jgi:hypothetical protein
MLTLQEPLPVLTPAGHNKARHDFAPIYYLNPGFNSGVQVFMFVLWIGPPQLRFLAIIYPANSFKAPTKASSSLVVV